MFAEIAKLQRIRALGLPTDLFSQTPRKVVSWYRARVAVEDVREIRRHPGPIRYALLAAYCAQREAEIIDTLISMMNYRMSRTEASQPLTITNARKITPFPSENALPGTG